VCTQNSMIICLEYHCLLAWNSGKQEFLSICGFFCLFSNFLQIFTMSKNFSIRNSNPLPAKLANICFHKILIIWFWYCFSHIKPMSPRILKLTFWLWKSTSLPNHKMITRPDRDSNPGHGRSLGADFSASCSLEP